ncbi:MAG: HD domain-containing protein [Candidatus Humimicrobiaceae bacterium]
MEKGLENKIIEKMKDVFEDNKKYIEHTVTVLNYAKEILEKEKGKPDIVIPAAILHDIGIMASIEKYDSIAGKYQEIEGPPIAKDILTELGEGENIVKKVAEIVGSHHSLGEINTKEFDIIWDADWLVNLKDEYDISDKIKLEKLIDKIFQTPTGKEMAKKIYLK